ncbi:MAG: esterase family protein [Planctomycetes bacterium]|nr:esterase family protein [Planctomycetota bacterium]
MNRLATTITIVLVVAAMAHAKDDYELGPDSKERAGVPKGDVTMFKWESKIFAGTTRDCWVYVPKQYDGKTPACVMVFQDGGGYQSPKGSYRATIVMDNLIHKNEIPVMIGIFINPGVFADKLDAKKKPASNRSFEYDTLSPQYAEFLEKEILPEVGKKYKLRQDAAGRGICGASSGGICAFTVAWERPDLFSKVLSHIGSFTNIRGGDRYPGIIRKTPKKDIRVFLQDGSNDLDNAAGNWYLGNLQMEAAFKFKGYDLKTVWGDGKHTGKHGGAILPDSMRWLWRGTPASATTPPVGPDKDGKSKKIDVPKEKTPAPATDAPAPTLPQAAEAGSPRPRFLRGRLFQGRLLRLFR